MTSAVPIALIILLASVALVGCSVEADGIVSQEPNFPPAGEPDGVLNCPRGLIEDHYPGVCTLYRDENADRICDLSQ